MKRWIIVGLACASLQVAAQSQGEVYDQTGLESGLTYRKGDPFLFCEQGQGWKKAPEQCWIPTPPYTGGFTMMLWCDPPNTYGKTWTSDDTKSLQEYLSICPRAIESGRWDGRNGSKDSTPMDH